MQYTVSINEKTKAITVTLADGTKGTARCCPTDRFDINTGIELALERAKVKQTEKNKPAPKPMTVMELVKALEKALPKGQCVVVGNGVAPTPEMKKWLHSMTDCKGMCVCDTDGGYDEGYADGYADGYETALGECTDECECDECYDEECECECHKNEREKLAKAIHKLIDGIFLD